MRQVVQFFYNTLNQLKVISSVAMVVAGLMGIVILTVFVITRIPGKTLAVLISTAGDCILMVIVVTSLNNVIGMVATNEMLKQNELKVKNQQLELEALVRETQLREKDRAILENRVEIAKQELEIADLTDDLRFLQSAMFNIQGFERILELGLLETELKQALVERRDLGVTKKSGPFENFNYRDEYLGIITHDIRAKFGIDLKALTLTDSNEMPNTVLVSGIASKFLGTSRNISTTEVSEIRRYNMDPRDLGSNKTQSIVVVSETDPENKNQAVRIAQEIERNYQQKLSQGFETSFMDESVSKLAENFIRIILLPLNRNIVFTDRTLDGALPLVDYIQRKIDGSEDQHTELAVSVQELQKATEELEYEKSKIEAEVQ